jgi:hypothetical protein
VSGTPNGKRLFWFCLIRFISLNVDIGTISARSVEIALADELRLWLVSETFNSRLNPKFRMIWPISQDREDTIEFTEAKGQSRDGIIQKQTNCFVCQLQTNVVLEIKS